MAKSQCPPFPRPSPLWTGAEKQGRPSWTSLFQRDACSRTRSRMRIRTRTYDLCTPTPLNLCARPTYQTKNYVCSHIVKLWTLASMASSSRGLSALELHQQYGSILAEQPLCDCPSSYLLHAPLASRSPPIPVSYAAVRQWWGNYRVTPGGIALDSAQALEEQYGNEFRTIAQEHNTAFKLCKCLRA